MPVLQQKHPKRVYKIARFIIGAPLSVAICLFTIFMSMIIALRNVVYIEDYMYGKIGMPLDSKDIYAEKS